MRGVSRRGTRPKLKAGVGAAKEQELAIRIAGGDLDAAAELAEGNIKWADALAKHYVKYFNRFSDDIIQAARLGLVKAAHRYRPGRARFTTYSRCWIDLQIEQWLSNSAHFLHIPDNLRRRVASATKDGQPMTDPIGQCARATWQAACRHANNEPASLESMQMSGAAILLPSEDGEGALLEHVISRERGQTIKALLSRLTKRHRLVIIQRFGLDGAEPRTLSQVGEAIGLSRERVRQIQDEALAKFTSGGKVGHRVRVSRAS